MKILERFIKKCNESLEVESLGLVGHLYGIKINGHKYLYSASSDQDLSIEQIANKFEKQLLGSKGKALAWLKSVTNLESGSVKGSSAIWTKDNPRYSD